jgi:hypothetical protein
MVAYPVYPIPVDEEQRLRDLERHGVISDVCDEHFERLVELASSIFQVPIALISLVEADRQWFLCRKGIEATSTPRDQAFCAHAIATTWAPSVLSTASPTSRRHCNGAS